MKESEYRMLGLLADFRGVLLDAGLLFEPLVEGTLLEALGGVSFSGKVELIIDMEALRMALPAVGGA